MTDFTVSGFLDMLYEDGRAQFVSPSRTGKEQWEAYKAGRLAEIRRFLRIDLLESRYEEALDFTLLESRKEGPVTIEKYRVGRIKKLPLCVYTLRPDAGNGKAVLYLNGHDPKGAGGALAGDVTENAGPDRKKTSRQMLAMEMACMGYLVFVPELFGFGDAKRSDAPEGTDACASCSMLAPRLLNCGLSLVGMRVFEAMKTLDFAEEVFAVHTFGAYGISGGGQVCSYTGILDERIETVMLAGYPNLYKYSILAMDHCICNYVPGQLAEGESHEVTALAAPKKLLTINGKKDPIFPLQGSLEAFAYLDGIYEKLGVPEQYTHVLFDGGHENSVPDVCKWLRENY